MDSHFSFHPFRPARARTVLDEGKIHHAESMDFCGRLAMAFIGKSASSGINARSAISFLSSLFLHLAALFVFYGIGLFEHGIARRVGNSTAERPSLAIRIVANEKMQSQTPPQKAASINLIGTQESSIEKSSAQSSQVRETSDLFSTPESSTETMEILQSTERDSALLPNQDYLPLGRLTRLPVPVADIDLNVAEISDVALPGTIELTVLINADGTVADVVMPIKNERTRVFADRVAERFKSARFIPGEMDGRAIKSRLEITVVYEDLQTVKN
ncbi:MAG: hypothetical protein JWQ21_1383 [Herminiimonas sp.]|nr:hypothetical protein [Herminiimonas sp.]